MRVEVARRWETHSSLTLWTAVCLCFLVVGYPRLIHYLKPCCVWSEERQHIPVSQRGSGSWQRLLSISFFVCLSSCHFLRTRIWLHMRENRNWPATPWGRDYYVALGKNDCLKLKLKQVFNGCFRWLYGGRRISSPVSVTNHPADHKHRFLVDWQK